MDLRTFLMQSPDLSDMACADDFASDWKRKRLNKGAHLTRQEQPETDEFVLLEGCLVSSICDQDGKEVSVEFYVGPCVITPNIARTRDGVSLVSIAAERLTWFRQAFPGYEDIFPHMLIASFLGITPVTMSRLRTGDKH